MRWGGDNEEAVGKKRSAMGKSSQSCMRPTWRSIFKLCKLFPKSSLFIWVYRSTAQSEVSVWTLNTGSPWCPSLRQGLWPFGPSEPEPQRMLSNPLVHFGSKDSEAPFTQPFQGGFCVPFFHLIVYIKLWRQLGVQFWSASKPQSLCKCISQQAGSGAFMWTEERLKWLQGTFKYLWNSLMIPLMIINFL